MNHRSAYLGTLLLAAGICVALGPSTARAGFCGETCQKHGFDPRRPLLPTGQPLAMGEAFRAVAHGPGAVFYNPAGLAFFPTYTLEINYAYRPWTDQHLAQAAVADSKTNPYLGAGAAYAYGHASRDPRPGAPTEKFTYHSSRMAMSIPLVEQTFALGLGLHYLNSEVDGKTRDNFLTIDVGTMVKIQDFLALAIVGHNLTNPASRSAPMALGAGVAAYPIPAMTLAFDLVTDFQHHTDPALEYHVGAEYQFVFGDGATPQAFGLRAGYVYDDARLLQTVSGGLVYVNPTGSMAFSFRQGVAGKSTNDEDGTFLFSVQLFL